MKKVNENWQNFLLSFFSEEGHVEKEVNGFWLVRHWNGNTKKWQVAVYTYESFENYKKYQQEEPRTQYQQDLVRMRDIAKSPI